MESAVHIFNNKVHALMYNKSEGKIPHSRERNYKMRLKRKIIKSTAAVLSAAFVCLFSAAGYYSSKLPAVITKEPSAELRIAEYPEISCLADADSAVQTASVFPHSEQFLLKTFRFVKRKRLFLSLAEIRSG